MIKTSILIVNWNTKELLRKCLLSLMPYFNNPHFEIIINDNASLDGSQKMIKNNFPKVQLLEQKDNIMFARGNNACYKKSQGKYLMLLNPDTEVLPNSLEILNEFLDSHPKTGAVAPQLLNPDGSLQRYCNRWPSILSILAYNAPVPKKWKQKIPLYRRYCMMDDDFNCLQRVDQPAAAAVMVRRDAIKRDPWLMDPKFPIFFNDVDLCKRIYKNGYNIYYEPKSQIIHYHGEGGVNTLKKVKKINILNKGRILYIQGLIQYFIKYH